MSEPMDETRAGYAEIKLASTLHPESGAWAFFMREVMRLPVEMTSEVIQVVRRGTWKSAPNPVTAVRLEAFEAYLHASTRTGLQLPSPAV